MTDVVVTVPSRLWDQWLDEGDLPGQPWSGYDNHFFIPKHALPTMQRGDRVYIVARNHLRGYAPLVRIETSCDLMTWRACLLRRGGAVAVTLPEPVRGFQGWRYRWWDREQELPFPEFAGAVPVLGGAA